MSLFAELVEEGEDAEGLVLGQEVTLQDLEEALAELAAQNEQLEVDCRGLEAHCRDLERAGWPVPCKLEDVILASETAVEEVPEPPTVLSDHVSVVVAAEAAAKAALEADKSPEDAAAQIGTALASESGMEQCRFEELASPVISRTVSGLFCDVAGDAPSMAAQAAAKAAITAGLNAEAAAVAGFVAAGTGA